ncbi:ATP-binding protein [Shimia marina]|uniref:histidine kinase n=1 Tax=Shimia marina TaxID=321267 RepID=A0A0P1ET17_9RHOB|nr:ATP-binding protein [Shimia marina]CUH53681.1 Osmolarity sensor protein EnvZ [Shimia marina]SFD71145.1 two-component system, OmpR family, osmolarity sensor histidine kinase EnvZ [Shimia marina]
MFFRWLKRYMPRSLYGRAALILILPVVLLQLVVSFGLVTRHFEGVTEQMSRAVAREVQLFIDAVAVKESVPEALPTVLNTLDMAVTYPTDLSYDDTRVWYDFSAFIISREFRASLPQVTAVQLAQDGKVFLHLDLPDGPAILDFDRDRVSASNSHQLFVNMVFFGAVLTFVAYLYLRNQLRPIKRLAVAAEAFGRGRSVAYSPGGAIEVRAAGSAFLDMRARIERQMEQRTLLLSGVSHDLRTPLTRFKLGLSLLDDVDREPLERDVEEMQRMLDAFLSFARGVYEDETEGVDPVLLTTEIVEDFKRSGADVALVSTEGSGEVELRPATVRRAVENLIGNAVRYANCAQVSVQITERYLRIRVEDDGPGISPAQREEALKPFARLEPGRNQNKGIGVGLGLSIAADVARAHGGILRLGESETLGGLRADLVLGM